MSLKTWASGEVPQASKIWELVAQWVRWNSNIFRALYTGEIWKHSFISMACPTIHTNPSQRKELFENAFQTDGIWKHRPCILVCLEDILKRELFENDGAMIIMWLVCPTFSQTQIPNEQWLLHVVDGALIFKVLIIGNLFVLHIFRTCLSRRRTSQGFLWPWSCIVEQCSPCLLLLWDSRWPSSQANGVV